MKAQAPAPHASGHRVEITGLGFGYPRFPIFEGFDFRSDARVTVLRGPSGCGKTTLLKLLYGMLKPLRTVAWCVPEPAFLVLQADTLVPWFTARQNIERFSRPLWDRMQHGPFAELIVPLRDKRACDMSYGQRRSIELARALAARSPLLLLDEPFNFLDPKRRRFFLDYIESQTGVADAQRIILTTHYVEDVGLSDSDSYEFMGDPPHQGVSRVRR